jgi:hypothetical protein
MSLPEVSFIWVRMRNPVSERSETVDEDAGSILRRSFTCAVIP